MTAFSALEASLGGVDARATAAAETLRIDVFGAQGETLQTIDLGQGSVTIGQAPGNQIVLEGAGVGRYHLRIMRDGARVTVVDLGSRTGTMLGEQRLPAQIDQVWQA